MKKRIVSCIVTCMETYCAAISWNKLVKEADDLFRKLFPITRSITGNGVRQTLEILREVADFDIKEIPSGTALYDKWIIPDEWNLRGAYVEDPFGRRILDAKDNNLHVVNYSTPVDCTLSFGELEKHLHTDPDLPEAIPYRTTYYKKDWGFCISYEQFKKMDRTGTYRVRIDSTLEPGSLTFGENIIRGNSGQEFLLSTYCCHPSMANDNLSGLILWVLLLRELKKQNTRHGYRFIAVPEGIGAVAYLFFNKRVMRKIQGGFVITTVAGPGKFGYRRTYLGNHLIDRVALKSLGELREEFIDYPFDAKTTDDSHYSAPYFRIPMGILCKDKYYEYDYYHTSFDNLSFTSGKNLIGTLKLYLLSIEKLEKNLTYKSLSPYCQPQLSKRGLYPETGGKNHVNAHPAQADELDLIRWMIFKSDGKTSLLDISDSTGFSMEDLHRIAEKLRRYNLLKVIK